MKSIPKRAAFRACMQFLLAIGLFAPPGIAQETGVVTGSVSHAGTDSGRVNFSNVYGTKLNMGINGRF